MLIFILLLYIIISELLPWLRKNNFTTSNRVNNTCGEVGVLLSPSTIKWRLDEFKCRGFTARCKPLGILKNKVARLNSTQHSSICCKTDQTAKGWGLKKSNPRVSQSKEMGYSEMVKSVTRSQPETAAFTVTVDKTKPSIQVCTSITCLLFDY